MTRHILLVNPLSSPGYLSEKLKSNKIKATAIYIVSNIDKYAYFKPNQDLFDKQVFLPDASYQEIINALGNQNFDYVLNGSEISVELADRLAQHYSPKYANDPQTAKLRYNKFLMHKELEKNNISSIHQTLYNISQQEIDYDSIEMPCFVKPLSSGGSVGAQRVLDKNELKQYVKNIQTIRDKNIYRIGDSDDKIIIAQLLEGTEYFVDSCSINGQHFISSIQLYQRQFVNNIPLPLYSTISTDTELNLKITDYIKSCLDILGVKNGLSHCDLFVSPEGKITLVELNPRIAGVAGASNRLASMAGHLNQLDLLLNNLYPELAIQATTINQQKYFARVNIYNQNILNKLNSSMFDSIKNVVRFAKTLSGKKNEPLHLVNVVGFVLCSNQNLQSLNEQVSQILALMNLS